MRLIIGAFCLAAVGSAFAQVTVPAGYDSTYGGSTFLYMVTTGRTYQYQIHADQLTGLVGQSLNGLQWRLPSSATTPWPPANASFNNFDIYIGPGVDPAARSLTFASNFTAAPTLVRSGSLTIPAGSFVNGSANNWGPTISFSNYLYTGGNLTIELRHDGMLGTTTSTSFDARPASSNPDYLVHYSALWTGTYAGTTGGQGNFFVTRLTAVPEPASLAALTLGAAALLRRRKPG